MTDEREVFAVFDDEGSAEAVPVDRASMAFNLKCTSRVRCRV
jgi:hypothetical protein